ncbi:MAG: cupin domain-containing protein, partial [Candidatus Promineifilaceae bacterium]
MTFMDVENLDSTEPIPGFHGRFIHSEKMTAAFWSVEAGSKAPDHSHPHEQITIVLEGQFRLKVDEETKILKPGIAAVIPSNRLPDRHNRPV